ncbi:MAG: phosphoadenylyl-sulfate reductase [Proteobacteria bacterium]|nr:phosphoadenylyl-sulfate reductase [Pseudomonadota bacterium]
MPRLDETRELLRDALAGRCYGRAAVVSSFGAESAVLLHLVSTIAPDAPVIFLETGKLFAETLAYRDRLTEHLGLTDVRSVRPDPGVIGRADAEGELWLRDPDRCCWHRKVEPLEEALEGFDAWINGRKRHHGAARASLPPMETAADGRTKINALAGWAAADIIAYFTAHALPRHPLEARGYRSIGCAVCTAPVAADAPVRAGRWAGLAKTECGIHAVPAAPSRREAA